MSVGNGLVSTRLLICTTRVSTPTSSGPGSVSRSYSPYRWVVVGSVAE